MTPLLTALSLLVTGLTKLGEIFSFISRWKIKREENSITREDSRRVKKIIKDGGVDEINKIYMGDR